MPYDKSSTLWSNRQEAFFRDHQLFPFRQNGPHCVSTVLAALTSAPPETFQGRINTQDPVSWSMALQPFGMKLALCPTDFRRAEFYRDELLRLDDLFTLSYFLSREPTTLLADPDENGWVCGSHIVLLHRNMIFDPVYGGLFEARRHSCWSQHTKRIFRVVPTTHERGI